MHVFLRALNIVCGLALIGSLAATAMAQQVPVRVVQASHGTLYVLQGSTSWTLVPDQLSDSDAAALNPTGEIDGTLPDQLLVVQAPAPQAAAPAPAAAPPVAAAAPTPVPAPAVDPTVGMAGQTATYCRNSDVGLANVKITVVSAAWASKISDSQSPQADMFVALLFDAANQGPKQLSWYGGGEVFTALQLQDDSGQVYRPQDNINLDSDAAALYGGSSDYFFGIDKGFTKRSIRVFEVSKTAHTLKLVNSSVNC